MKTSNYKPKIFTSLLYLAVLFLPMLGQGQSVEDTVKRIDALFAHWNEQTPGGVLRISRGDELLYHKAFGMADLEHGVANTTETIFEAGSVSKQFTATAVLLLVREGKISLGEDVRKYIPELPEYERPITLRHLMNHTSGLRDWGTVARLGGWPRTTRVYTNEQALDYILRQKGLNHVPGEEYQYSNSNYTLLTLVAERVSGQRLPDFTREHIFKPLGMNHTKWRDNFREIVPGRAIGYDRSPDSSSDYLMSMPFENTYGHAALLTTVADLDTWNQSWAQSSLGGEELLQLRTKRGKLNNGEQIDYAAGVVVTTFKGHPEVNHSGGTAGYRAWLGWYPDEQLSVVILSNDATCNTWQLSRDIAVVFFGKQPEQGVPEEPQKADTFIVQQPGKLRELEGVYYSEECDGEIGIRADKTGLQALQKAVGTMPLKAAGEDTFQYEEALIEFKRDAGGKVIAFTISVPRARNVLFERVR